MWVDYPRFMMPLYDLRSQAEVAKSSQKHLLLVGRAPITSRNSRSRIGAGVRRLAVCLWLAVLLLNVVRRSRELTDRTGSCCGPGARTSTSDTDRR